MPRRLSKNVGVSAVHSRHAAREPIAVRVAVPIGVLFTALASLATLLGAVTDGPVDDLAQEVKDLYHACFAPRR